MNFIEKKDAIQKRGFGILVVFLIGMIAGCLVANWYFSYRVGEAIDLHGFRHRGIVYNVTLRPGP